MSQFELIEKPVFDFLLVIIDLFKFLYYGGDTTSGFLSKSFNYFLKKYFVFRILALVAKVIAFVELLIMHKLGSQALAINSNSWPYS